MSYKLDDGDDGAGLDTGAVILGAQAYCLNARIAYAHYAYNTNTYKIITNHFFCIAPNIDVTARFIT